MAGSGAVAPDGAAVYGSSSLMSGPSSRTFFIIDKSKMVQESDTLERAKVVYIPESEFKKVGKSHDTL